MVSEQSAEICSFQWTKTPALQIDQDIVLLWPCWLSGPFGDPVAKNRTEDKNDRVMCQQLRNPVVCFLVVLGVKLPGVHVCIRYIRMHEKNELKNVKFGKLL